MLPLHYLLLVGKAGIEPATTCFQGTYATSAPLPDGANGGSRTPDTMGRNHVLYPLSYIRWMIT